MTKELPFYCTNPTSGLTHTDIELLPSSEEVQILLAKSAPDSLAKSAMRRPLERLLEKVKDAKAFVGNSFPQSLPLEQDVSQIVELHNKLTSDTRPESTSDTSFIKERHGYDKALSQAELDELVREKNQQYDRGELVRASNVIRAVEVVRMRDFVNLHTLTGHDSYDDYLKSKYDALNEMYAPLGITVEISRVIVVEDDVQLSASWHEGWLENGFHDSNGADGIWYDGEFRNPASDSRWDKVRKVSSDDCHEWQHRVAHTIHNYDADSDMSDSDHPAFEGVPVLWKRFHDGYRGWNFMNGGNELKLPENIVLMMQRRVDEGWLHDGSRTIKEITRLPNEMKEDYRLRLGTDWAGARVQMYRVLSEDGEDNDPHKKTLSTSPIVDTDAISNATDVSLGEIMIDNPYKDDGEYANPINSNLFIKVTRSDGTVGFMYMTWEDFFLFRTDETNIINVRLATVNSPNPQDFEYRVTYGDVPDDPPKYTVFLPIVTR